MRLYPYSYNAFPFYHSGDRKFLAADAVVSNREASEKAIAKIISESQVELKYELVKLGLACSCTIDEMKESDLINMVVESAGNKELQKWFSGKDSSAIITSSDKAKYKSDIAQASANYKSHTAKSGSGFKASDVIALTGITLLLFGAWAISYYNTKKK